MRVNKTSFCPNPLTIRTHSDSCFPSVLQFLQEDTSFGSLQADIYRRNSGKCNSSDWLVLECKASTANKGRWEWKASGMGAKNRLIMWRLQQAASSPLHKQILHLTVSSLRSGFVSYLFCFPPQLLIIISQSIPTVLFYSFILCTMHVNLLMVEHSFKQGVLLFLLYTQGAWGLGR